MSSDTEPTLDLGIHYGITEAAYNELPFARASSLLWGKVSPRHMRDALDGRLKLESAAMRFGSAMHCRLLEPEVFKKRYLVATPCQGLIKTGDRKGQKCGKSASRLHDELWYCGTHSPDGASEPAYYLSPDEINDMEAIADKLLQHPVVRLLRQHGGHEATVIWECNKLRVKSRLDKLVTETYPCIIDLKKIRVAHGTREKFRTSLLEYDYHIRAAMYVDAVKQQTDLDCKFIWVCIEDSSPHEIAVYEADEHDIAIGRHEYKRLIAMHNDCKLSGQWPGYSTDIQQISLPDWYVKRFETFQLD